MTRYFIRISRPLYADRQALNYPEGFNLVRVLRLTPDWAEVEVEDEGADPSIEGRTVLPWFQFTIDGKCVITEREVLENEHDQIRVEPSELEAG